MEERETQKKQRGLKLVILVLVIIIIILSIVSCRGHVAQQNEYAQLNERVMALNDEVANIKDQNTAEVEQLMGADSDFDPDADSDESSSDDSATNNTITNDIDESSIIQNIKNWLLGSDLLLDPDEIFIAKDRILDSGDLDFKWGDDEVSNDITIDEDGEVAWDALTDHPAPCPDGYAVSSVGDELGCIAVDNSIGGIDWTDLQSYPSSCPDGYAIKSVGDTLECVAVGSGGGSTVEWTAIQSFPASCGTNQAIQAVGNSLTCVDLPSGSGPVDWTDIQTFPTACSSNQAIQAVGNSLTCVDLPSENPEWTSIQSFPNACGSNQAIQAVGSTLTCVDLPSGSGPVDWTDIQTFPTACSSNQAIQAVGSTLTCVDLPSSDVDWTDIQTFPTACGSNQAIQAVGNSLTCVDLPSENPEWTSIQSFPTSCGANQAVQAVGSTLTCVDLPSGGSSLLTDGGDVTYITSQTDDFAIGGSDTSAPFYFDVSTGQFIANSIYVGNGTDGVSIGNDGTIRFLGSATMWDDIRVPVTAATRGAVDDPDFAMIVNDGVSGPTGSPGVHTYHFDPDFEEELYFQLQLPHKYMEGSDIYPHMHWLPTTANTGDVVWALECVWGNIDDVFSVTSTITVSDTADGVARKQQIVGFDPPMDGTGKRISSMLSCRVFRDADNPVDTYPDDAALLEIDFHYEIDKIGSDNQF